MRFSILAFILLSLNVYAYDFELTWHSSDGQVLDSGRVLTDADIREYWIEASADQVTWEKLSTEPKTADGELNGYKYTGTTEVSVCYRIRTILMGWAAIDKGGALCIDLAAAEPLTCQ